MKLLLPARLQSERLLLRRAMPEDAAKVAEAVAETLPRLHWFQWGALLARYGDLDDMGSRAMSGQTCFDELDNPVWHFWHGDTFLGEVIIKNPHWESSRAVELQIWLRQSGQGRGFASEALRATMAHLFEVEGCELIEACIAPANGPSRKLFTRVGFRSAGIRMDHSRYVATLEDWDRSPRDLGVVVLTHPECLEHKVGPDHPERPERLSAVVDALQDLDVTWLGAPRNRESAARAHPPAYLDLLESMLPEQGLRRVSPDTVLSPSSLAAALRGVGGAVAGVDLVLSGRARSAFVATRPPGHHAEPIAAMGFCLLATAATAALHAVNHGGLTRVAIVDIDVHHGNGTAAVVAEMPEIQMYSTYEQYLFPNPLPGRSPSNVQLLPLPHRCDGTVFRALCDVGVVRPLRSFAPQLIVVSAGFDAHEADENSTIRLRAEDYAWIADQLQHIAPVVAILEGGYELESLAASTRAFVHALCHPSVISSRATDSDSTPARN